MVDTLHVVSSIAVDNAIVQQTETILALINTSEDYQDLSKAHARLELCSCLWDALGCEGRTARMEEAIRERAMEMMDKLDGSKLKAKTFDVQAAIKRDVQRKQLRELINNLSE